MKTINLGLFAIAAVGLLAVPCAQADSDITITIRTAGDSALIGIVPKDGIALSGNDIMVTRNGVTEKLTKELTLENGLRVQPNGSVVSPNGTNVTLKPNQMLTFDGTFINLNDAQQAQGQAPSSANPAQSKTTEDEAAEVARAEAERRAKAAQDSAEQQDAESNEQD